MWKKLNNFLNVFMHCSVGVFIGHTVYVYWEYKNYPLLYEMRSAPWYADIIVNGLFSVVVLLIASIVKLLIRAKLEKE